MEKKFSKKNSQQLIFFKKNLIFPFSKESQTFSRKVLEFFAQTTFFIFHFSIVKRDRESVLKQSKFLAVLKKSKKIVLE